MKIYNKAVLAGNKREYNYFIQNVFPEEARSLYVYIESVDRIRGLRFDSLITVGTFYERKDASELKDWVVKSIFIVN